jgi:DNA-directed RNA polymerase subunit RPC12/RpoP
MSIDELIHVEGKTYIYCYRCGTKAPIPPRTKENLEHIREVKAESDRISASAPNTVGDISFTRTIVCPSCKNIIHCRDEHTDILLRSTSSR